MYDVKLEYFNIKHNFKTLSVYQTGQNISELIRNCIGIAQN